MADNTIDSLQIEISADANIAEKSLNRLADSLLKVQKSLSGLKAANLRDFSGAIKQVGNATKSLDIGKVTSYANALMGLSNSFAAFSSSGKKIGAVASTMQKISGLDFSSLQIQGDFSGVENLARAMGELAIGAGKLSAVKPTDINRSFKSLAKLSALNFSGLAQSVSSLNGLDFSSIVKLGQAFQGFSSALAGSSKIAAGTAKIFNSLALLTNSAGNIPLIQQNLPLLSSEINTFINSLANAPLVDAGIVSVVTALSGLANAGGKAQKAAAALPDLAAGINSFMVSLSNAPNINTNTVKVAEALAQIATAGGKASAATKKLQKDIVGLSASMGNLNAGTKKTVSSLKSFAARLIAAAGITGGIYGIVRAIKSAVLYSSDLAEAQNVVNQGFGDLSYTADEFAKNAIYSFGMSELAAKNAAGQFAAMGKSMGISQKEAAQMALSLTALTGDLASFWNVRHDVAQTALESIFTGETESLKKFSVVLTEANLQQFAYANGINKSISSMTQAEKVQLRYAYVMEQTAIAQGDFSATSGNWSNQIRILTGQFQTLAGIVGGGLVAAFLPVVKVVNVVLAKIIQLANVLASFAGKLFGIESQTVGIGAGLSDVAVSAGNAGNSMGSAADGIENVGSAAGKAKKNLNGFIAGWHEVNNMTSNDSSGGSGGGAGGVSMPDIELPSEYEIGIKAEDEASPVLEAMMWYKKS